MNGSGQKGNRFWSDVELLEFYPAAYAEADYVFLTRHRRGAHKSLPLQLVKMRRLTCPLTDFNSDKLVHRDSCERSNRSNLVV